MGAPLDEDAFLQKRPDAGDLIVGTKGLRKLRWALQGRGKSGGARVIYLHVPEADLIYFITVYGKDQKDDLSPGDKRLYRQLAVILKQQSRADKEP